MVEVDPQPSDVPVELREAIEQLIASPPVQGLLLVGSRSRGYHDSKSDYDLEVIVDDDFAHTLEPAARLSLVWDGKPHRSRLLGDILTESRSSFEGKTNSTLDVDHWPYEAAVLWYDRDGEIGPLVKAIARFPDDIWEERLKLHYVDFWYHTARALKIAERESTLNHGLVLYRAAYACIQCIFVLNRRWPPLPHWTEQALERSELRLRPTDDVALLTKALTTHDAQALQRLHDALDPLLDAEEITWHHNRVTLLLEILGSDFHDARERWAAF
ncbi:MAG: DUF4037 domain-containing protein [Chloroflexota bacterium]|nr:DUF4037 domain-containing protein [Chloroflexota bacterium]